MLWFWKEQLGKNFRGTPSSLIRPPIFKYNGNGCFWNNDIEKMSNRLRNPKFSQEMVLSKAIVNLTYPRQNLDMMIIHNHLASPYHSRAFEHYSDWFGDNKKRLIETIDTCLDKDPDYYITHFNKMLYDSSSLLYQVLKTHRYRFGAYVYGSSAPELIDARNLVIAHQNPDLKKTLAPGKTT